MTRVAISQTALEDLEELPKSINDRILRIFERLADWPNVSGARALSGNRAGSYRIRTGDYRLLFRVEGDEILIERVAHRRDIYED